MELSSIIDIAVYSLVGVMVGIGMLFGFIRGFKRQTIRFVTVIFSVAVSYFICKLLTPAILSFFNDMNVGALVGGDAENLLAQIDADTLNCIAALPAALLIAPILTIPIFLVLHLITEIIHKILCGVFLFLIRPYRIVPHGKSLE